MQLEDSACGFLCLWSRGTRTLFDECSAMNYII
eukprot:COSAG06_NODE_65497_length_257_cov_0.443038_1_plen_32_part_10